MRSTKLLTAALLVLTLTPAAWGGDQADRYGRRDPHDGYNRYDRYDTGRVADLARQLDRTASYVHREFEQNNRRPSRSEERVAVRLHELERQADRFYQQVGGGYRQSASDRDFQRLLDAFYAAEESARNIRSRGYVERGLDEIGGIISELTRYYGRYDDYSRRRNAYRDRGRYDDRYDRDRRDDDWDGYRRPPQE
jgi:hypothetical protein